MQTEKGVVVKGIGGFYFVQLSGGDRIFQCRARGKLRQKGTLMAGDRVLISIMGSEDGVVEEVLRRDTELLRPPVANIDQVLIVHSLDHPPVNPNLIDKMLALALQANLRAALVLTKADVVVPDVSEFWQRTYTRAGFPVYVTSVKQSRGLDDVRRILAGNITVVSGPSGVGKSSLLNALDDRLALKTGEISDRMMRGRHTTRHVELLPVDGGGFVVDTPGFSSLDVSVIPKNRLGTFFPDLYSLSERCRFNGCLHRDEPDCAVKRAVEEAQVAESRYKSYLQMLAEIERFEERRYT